MRNDTDDAVTAVLDSIVTMTENAMQNALSARAKHNPATMNKRQKRLMAAVMQAEPFVQSVARHGISTEN